MVTLEDAREVARTLAEKTPSIAVVAFGSVARTGEGNDLDLLAVTEREAPENLVGAELREFHKRFAMDRFVVTKEVLNREFRKGSLFLRRKISSGSSG